MAPGTTRVGLSHEHLLERTEPAVPFGLSGEEASTSPRVEMYDDGRALVLGGLVGVTPAPAKVVRF